MRLRAHDEKPAPKFRGNGDEPYYLGIELEVEAPDREKMEEGLALHNRPRHFHAKRDGSLNSYGWELITMPIGKSMWLDRRPAERTPVYQFFDLVADLKSMEYQSHDGGRCGLHVHVCRKAFGVDLTSTNHYYWFSRLVNGPLFRRLSQRSDDSIASWAAQRTDWEKSIHTSSPYSRTRYKATNITPRTIEVRIFRGNLREDRIRKNVESVIAAVEFARERIELAPCKENPDFAWMCWVHQHDQEYPYLSGYLDVLDLPSGPPVTEEAAAVAV